MAHGIHRQPGGSTIAVDQPLTLNVPFLMVECTAVTQPAPGMTDPQQTSGSLGESTPLQAQEPGRRFGIRDGLFQAITQGSGEQYLSAFALLLHATPFHLSLLSALPQLIGMWAQLVSVKVSHWFPNRKSQVLWGIIGQSASWIPIIALPIIWPQLGPWLLVAGAAGYFACTHFTAPAWNSLITDLVEEGKRGAYFARRARVMALSSFLALCAGGALLSLFERLQNLWTGFGIMFLLAGLSRSLPAFFLARVTDLPPSHASDNPTGFREFLRTGSSRSFQYFLVFSGLMHAAVLISGPFFVVYMIQDLHLPYWEYGTWLAAGIIGQLVTLTAWGQFGDRFGNKALLTITGYLVPVLPMLYLISTDWPFLVMVNFWGGAVWAGLSLGLQNYVFDAVHQTDRAKAVAVVSVVNALGWAAGTLLGSWLIAIVPVSFQVGYISFDPVSNLPWIFFISGGLRLIVSALFLRTFGEPRPVEQRTHLHLLWELPLLKPLCELALRRQTGGSR